MFRLASRIWPLFVGIGLFGVGQALLMSLIGIRRTLEREPRWVVGLVSCAYFSGGIAGALFCSQIIVSVGHIRAYAGFAAALACMTLAHTFTDSACVWIPLRAGSGFVAYGLLMVCESWLNEEANRHTRGRILSSYALLYFLSLGLGQLLLNTHLPSGPRLFIVSGMLLTASLIPLALVRCSTPEAIPTARFAMNRVWSVSRVGLAGCFGAGMMSGTFYTLGPVFAKLSGLTTSQTSLFMATVIAGGLTFQWPIGWASDLFHRQTILGCVALLAAVSAPLIAWSVGLSGPWVYAAAFFFGAALCSIYPLSVAHANDHVQRRETVQLSRSLLFLFGTGAATATFTGGLVMELVGPAGVFYQISFVAILLTAATLVSEEFEEATESVFVPAPQTSAAVASLDPRQHRLWEEERLGTAADSPSPPPRNDVPVPASEKGKRLTHCRT